MPVKIKMLSLSARKPLNRWAYDRMQPGAVGSVGDANVAVQFQSTYPGDFSWDPQTSGKNEPMLGSNVSDGMMLSYNSGGGPARTLDGFIGGNRDIRTQYGTKFQDLRPEDRADEPVMGEMPQLSWRMQQASVLNAQRTGNLFQRAPGGGINAPRGAPRGGNVPTVVQMESGTRSLFDPNLFEDDIGFAGIGGQIRRRGGGMPMGNINSYGSGNARGRPNCNMRSQGTSTGK